MVVITFPMWMGRVGFGRRGGGPAEGGGRPTDGEAGRMGPSGDVCLVDTTGGAREGAARSQLGVV